jgi:diguanylate cyclase
LIVRPGSNEVDSAATIERLRLEVAAERLEHRAREIQVTFSAGIAEWDRRASAETLIGSADRALAAAKRAGKNRTVRYSQATDGGAAASLGRGSS